MSSEQTIVTENFNQTIKLGEDFSQEIKPGEFLAFFGDLGIGKTTFVQGLAKGLGIKRRIISPTFIIVRTYLVKSATFYHVDLYRTQSTDDLLGIGLDQIIEGRNNIVALEWAEKMGDLLPKKRIDLFFRNLGDDKREIKIIRHE